MLSASKAAFTNERDSAVEHAILLSIITCIQFAAHQNILVKDVDGHKLLSLSP